MAKNIGMNNLAFLDQKLAMAKRCSHEGAVAGAKAAVVATLATAIPTLASVRMLPWAKANLNHTAQALIISTVAGAAYFIVADKTVLVRQERTPSITLRRLEACLMTVMPTLATVLRINFKNVPS